MYFLSPEEYKYVTRKLLMEARRDEVHPDLRGWNWAGPPVISKSRARLGVSDIGSLYCPIGKDLYLKKVAKVGFRANQAMVEGLFLHRVVSEVFTRAKRILYKDFKITSKEFLKELGPPDFEKEALAWGFSLNPEDSRRPVITKDILHKASIIWDFEESRIAYRIDDIRSRYPFCEADSFVFLVLPVVVEQRLDGVFLGLSQNLAVDGYLYSQNMVLDLKFDPEKREFHRLTTTGYAMVMESLYEHPVDLGCIIYVKFRHNRVVIERDFHHISDELRQWFLEERDRKMRIIDDEIDPGIAEECYSDCPYFDICHGTVK